MTKRQLFDLVDELTTITENIETIINGVEFDDRNIIKPLIKINSDLAVFTGKLNDMTLQE